MTESLVQSLFDGPLDIVGDVHGEIDPLRSLMRHLGYDDDGSHPDGRRLIFVGDLTDRGPDSPAVVNLVQRLSFPDLDFDDVDQGLEHQNKNPVKKLTSGPEERVEKPIEAAGKKRYEKRVHWWNDYRDAFCVFGHYSIPDGDPRGSGAAFCVDYGVGKRWTERREGKTCEFKLKLAALRWPERVVVFDEGEVGHLPENQLKVLSVVETAIYVDDLQAAEEFYQSVLGLKIISRELGRHVFFQVGESNVLLAFIPNSTLKGDKLPPHGANGPGHFALGIETESFEAWRQHLATHNVKIETEIEWPAGGRSIYLRDPAGNSVELITPGVWRLPSEW